MATASGSISTVAKEQMLISYVELDTSTANDSHKVKLYDDTDTEITQTSQVYMPYVYVTGGIQKTTTSNVIFDVPQGTIVAKVRILADVFFEGTTTEQTLDSIDLTATPVGDRTYNTAGTFTITSYALTMVNA